MRETLLAGAGGVIAAALGSLCCIGPILFVTLGVGAGAASAFEPLRPLFGVLMVALLGIGFYTVYGRPETADVCGSHGGCERRPRSNGREKVLLWSATALAVVLWSFTYWSTILV